jgi:hypothetical protein
MSYLFRLNCLRLQQHEFKKPHHLCRSSPQTSCCASPQFEMVPQQHLLEWLSFLHRRNSMETNQTWREESETSSCRRHGCCSWFIVRKCYASLGRLLLLAHHHVAWVDKMNQQNKTVLALFAGFIRNISVGKDTINIG